MGHSLGAQTMGYAGKEIQRLEGTQVGRISGECISQVAVFGYEDLSFQNEAVST